MLIRWTIEESRSQERRATPCGAAWFPRLPPCSGRGMPSRAAPPTAPTPTAMPIRPGSRSTGASTFTGRRRWHAGHLRRDGEGRPIVFIHGLSGSWQNWLENIPVLASRPPGPGARPPGFGASPLPTWAISVPAYGSLVNDFSRELNLHAVTLVGNSMGGFISAEVAIGDPMRVERLVLVSAAGISHATMRRHPAEISAPLGRLIEPVALRCPMRACMAQAPRHRLRQRVPPP